MMGRGCCNGKRREEEEEEERGEEREKDEEASGGALGSLLGRPGSLLGASWKPLGCL